MDIQPATGNISLDRTLVIHNLIISYDQRRRQLWAKGLKPPFQIWPEPPNFYWTFSGLLKSVTDITTRGVLSRRENTKIVFSRIAPPRTPLGRLRHSQTSSVGWRRGMALTPSTVYVCLNILYIAGRRRSSVGRPHARGTSSPLSVVTAADDDDDAVPGSERRRYFASPNAAS